MRRIVQVIAVLAACLAARPVYAAAARDMTNLGRSYNHVVAAVDDHSNDSIRDVVSVPQRALSQLQG